MELCSVGAGVGSTAGTPRSGGTWYGEKSFVPWSSAPWALELVPLPERHAAELRGTGAIDSR